ncbi:hypothetical protein [Sphingomonas sp.]|uniref:hypothetical protein n=1 Tax=Sphingomonas sp. TaxID=28214 RepID=UPI00179C75AB|nr:hypothetical protein [Sphingomonas sp.]MBA3510612.1 hypothetical protein [Sphingomonas sp.]
MVRSLLLVSALIATIAACSPAEPPLLIDGGQPPATEIGQGPQSPDPTADPTRTSDERPAASR